MAYKLIAIAAFTTAFVLASLPTRADGAAAARGAGLLAAGETAAAVLASRADDGAGPSTRSDSDRPRGQWRKLPREGPSMERVLPAYLGLSAVLLAACEAHIGGTAVPAALKPEGQRLSEHVAAKGVQICECRITPNAPGHTVGGVAPSRPFDSASIGATERVPYTAEYLLYAS